ncbi:nucleoside-diphosphate kinase [Kitasatospora purpeofusca]|uniref:nucleoside-diphosphate kinase n=1 Tax=Kitasatospora purpeofusca TaxID=67352 RepID=UPI0036D33F6E
MVNGLPEERSFLLFKPDGVERGLVEHGVAAVRRTGLGVVERRRFLLTEGQIGGLYAQVDPEARPLTAGLLRRCLTGRPVELVVVRGPHARGSLLEVKAALRSAFGSVIYANIVHCPDTDDEVADQLKVLDGDGRGRFRPVRPSWQGWGRERIEAALDAWWADVPRIGRDRPTRWARPSPQAEHRVRIAVPERWVIAFDDIAVLLAQLAATDDPGYAVRATLAALYDAGGLAIGAGSSRHAEELADRAQEFGLLAEVDEPSSARASDMCEGDTR